MDVGIRKIANQNDSILPTFSSITLAALDAAGAPALDALSFGVVGLDASGQTQIYNLTESQMAGLSFGPRVGS